MTAEIALIGLLVVAVGVALVAKRLKVPFTIALVVTGLTLGAIRPVMPGLDGLFAIHLTPEILFAVLLPGLLYEAAFHITIRDVARVWRAIGLLAVGGVAVAALVVGLLTWGGLSLFGAGVPFLAALLFGALICATDPISVLALLKELGVARRLRMVMEGESLVNDGIAVVMFAAIAGVLGVGHHGAGETVDAAWILRLLLWEIGVGILVGTTLGAIQSFITSQVDDHLVEITMTVVVAFGSYLAADSLHASGVIAVVSAGILSGNYGGRYGMSPTTRVAVVSLWEVVTFLANSVVFLLIGLETDLVRLAGRAHLIVLAWLAVVVARAVAVWGLAPLLRWSRERLEPKWKTVVWWGGLHGALSMVLALSLPHDFVHRELIVDLTFGTVLLSILVQGLTIKPLLRRLGLGSDGDERIAYDLIHGRMRATGAALRELHRQHEEHRIDNATFDALHEELDARIKQAKLELEEVHHADETRRHEAFTDLRRSLLMIERDSLLSSHSTGAISENAMKDLLREVDERIEELEGG